MLGPLTSQSGVFPHDPGSVLSPGDGKGIRRRKKLVVEKIMEGKEAGK